MCLNIIFLGFWHAGHFWPGPPKSMKMKILSDFTAIFYIRLILIFIITFIWYQWTNKYGSEQWTESSIVFYLKKHIFSGNKIQEKMQKVQNKITKTLKFLLVYCSMKHLSGKYGDIVHICVICVKEYDTGSNLTRGVPMCMHFYPCWWGLKTK